MLSRFDSKKIFTPTAALFLQKKFQRKLRQIIQAVVAIDQKKEPPFLRGGVTGKN
jgi:hypothetical protein